MLTKKEIAIIALCIIAYFAFVFLAAWLLFEFCPLLIPAIVFIPWLGAALKEGAQI